MEREKSQWRILMGEDRTRRNVRTCLFLGVWLCASFISVANAQNKQVKCTVYVWLATECPLSQKYTLTLNKLQEHFRDSPVHFTAAFPSETKRTIKAFNKTYHFRFTPLEVDTLRRKYRVTTTPEVLLLDQFGKCHYRGAIDDQAEVLGKFKSEAHVHYLRDAISNYLAGKPISVTFSPPLGCLID